MQLVIYLIPSFKSKTLVLTFTFLILLFLIFEYSSIPKKKGGGPQKLDKVLSYMSDSPDGGIDNGKNQKEAQSTV